MWDFLELLAGILDVGDVLSGTGRWALSRFDWKSNAVAEFFVGLLIWGAGFGLLGVTIVVLSKS
jgi:hypothetical protein